jgi:hypothetical protein
MQPSPTDQQDKAQAKYFYNISSLKPFPAPSPALHIEVQESTKMVYTCLNKRSATTVEQSFEVTLAGGVASASEGCAGIGPPLTAHHAQSAQPAAYFGIRLTY